MALILEATNVLSSPQLSPPAQSNQGTPQDASSLEDHESKSTETLAEDKNHPPSLKFLKSPLSLLLGHPLPLPTYL